MDLETKLELIEKGSVELVEILTKDELQELLATNEHLTSYMGVATSGPVHIGYLKPINKQLDLIKAGFRHKVLIADVHAYLDDLKCPWRLLKQRATYYTKCFQLCGLSPDKAEYVTGSDFQMSKDYVSMLYMTAGMVTSARALRAASETCRITENPYVSAFLYPLLQVIDQIFLKVDLSYGGLDQRHVYALGRELLPKMNIKPPVAIFTERSPGLKKGTGMSASQPETTIQVHDSEKIIDDKIMKAYCPPKTIEENPIFEILKYFVMPRYRGLEIERSQEFGGNIFIENADDMKKRYLSGELHPKDLKLNAAIHLKKILKPARKYFEEHPETLKRAFPEGY